MSGAFTCFKCATPATVLTYISTKMNVPTTIVEMHSDNILGSSAPGHVDVALVEMCHCELMANQEYITRILNKHGVTRESIVKYRLGYYDKTKRVIIPVYDGEGSLINTRQYKYKLADNEAKIISPKGTKSSIYLVELLKTNDTIVVTGGEFKAILLNQMGFPAIACTAGENSDYRPYAHLFKGKNVVVIMDMDKAGRKGAEAACIAIKKYATSVKNVALVEVSDIDGGDVTNYFVDKHHTSDELKTKIEGWPEYELPVSKVKSIDFEEDNEPIALKLSESSLSEHKGKLLTTTAVVSAKDTAPYVIPTKASVHCERDKDYCHLCPVFHSKDATPRVEVKHSSKVILELINKGEEAQNKILQEIVGIPSKCKTFKLKVEESSNVEEIRLIPQITIGDTNEDQVTRKAYHVGHGITCNAAYEFKARACAEPLDSHSTLVCYDSEPMQDDINSYTPTVDLSIFRPKEWTKASINEKLSEIYKDLSENVTRIHRRDDLHLFYDLIWHSALYINFQGRQIKGWGDGLVIGDSGQGKSECSSRLMEYYKCGERVDTKRASVAGIVGGLQETGKRWFITWGTIPLNDRRLVILEEIKGMPPQELATMTDMRSSGVAEIIKIERAKAKARVRLIWISNPRGESKMAGYNYGVDAVKELIGSLEDIRRFDMVMAVASGEVPLDVINQKYSEAKAPIYTSELCQSLIRFSWSRISSQVVISPDTEDAILACANRMGNKYSSSCPIVESSDQRLKIARLSTALAIRLYSCDDDANVNVRPCHVEVVEEFLNRIYGSKALGYAEYSQAQRNEEEVKDPASIEARLIRLPNCKDLIQGLIESEVINVADVINYTEYDGEAAADVIGYLARSNCLKRNKKGGYRKTAAFIVILKSMDRANLSSESLKEQLAKGEL